MNGCFKTNTWKQCSTQHAVKPLNSLGWDIVADKILHQLKKKQTKTTDSWVEENFPFTQWHYITV